MGVAPLAAPHVAEIIQVILPQVRFQAAVVILVLGNYRHCGEGVDAPRAASGDNAPYLGHKLLNLEKMIGKTIGVER